MQKVKEEEEKTFRVPEIPVDIDEQKITELAVDLRSSNNNIHIFALHKLLTLILLIPNINGSIHQQDIIWTLKGFLTDGTKSELKEISIAILRLIGLRWGKHEYSIKGESIATLLIQIILSQNQDLSHSASQSILQIIRLNIEVRTALLSTRFINTFLEILKNSNQDQNNFSKSSTSSSASDSEENEQIKIVPIGIQNQILNILLELVEHDNRLAVIDELIPTLQFIRLNIDEQETKQSAEQILDKYQSQKQFIQSSSSSSSSHIHPHHQTQNERIAELESRNHWLQQQIVVERTETERLSVELVADHEAYEQYQRQKEQERSQRLRNEGEIGRIRYEMKRKAVLAKRSQIILTEQQELNQTSVKFTIALPDSPYIHSNGSFTYTTNNYEQHKFQIDALLQDGIYRCNFKANNAAGISVGIIKGGFNFPLIGNPFYGPNNDKFSLFSQTGKVSFSNQISGGNAQFQSGDYITLEVNLKTHGTAHLFINGVQQNVYLSGIPLQIEFIFYLEGKNVSITVNSIKHLNIPTVKKLDNQRKIVWKED